MTRSRGSHWEKWNLASSDRGVVLGNAAQGANVYVNNRPPRGPGIDYGSTPNAYPGFSYVSGSYGAQYNQSGWAFSINPHTLSPDQFHTFYVYAVSATTGHESLASVQLFVKGDTTGNVLQP